MQIAAACPGTEMTANDESDGRASSRVERPVGRFGRHFIRSTGPSRPAQSRLYQQQQLAPGMGVGLAHVGEFAFVLVLLGWESGVISE
jgi:hypothetical protein